MSNFVARTASGLPLQVDSAGIDAFRVAVDTREDWFFEYDVALGSPPSELYHRASSGSADHLILIGVDVWPRFFDDPAALEPPPAERFADDVQAAFVRFHLDELPTGWVVVSAAREIELNHFELREHPERSVFAVGPYRFEDIDRTLGVRAAIHRGWNVAREQIVDYSRQLVRTQASDFGAPPGGPTLMIFTPLPTALRPAGAVRSSGMVWDRSLILFSGAGASVPLDRDEIREMMAVFLGHELFHLYVPWGLPVTRSLSWLSEGWAEHAGRTSARKAGILSASGTMRSLTEAYERYVEMGGARAGSLQQASDSDDESLRALLYVRGELVFRILALEWESNGNTGSFDSVLWRRLSAEHDGVAPLEPDTIRRVLNGMVSPTTVRRVVDGAAMITLPELALGR